MPRSSTPVRSGTPAWSCWATAWAASSSSTIRRFAGPPRSRGSARSRSPPICASRCGFGGSVSAQSPGSRPSRGWRAPPGWTGPRAATTSSIVRRGSGPGDAPRDAEVWSLRCWWRSRGPEAEAGDARRWVGRIGVPLMLVRAGDDPVVPDHSADVLAAVARDGGVPVEVVHVHDADHSFWDRVPEALERVPEWIDGLARPPRAASARPAPPPPGPAARLLTVRAPDGVVHDALLHIDADALAARAARDGRRTAIVHLHGNQGNFTVGALRFLHPAPRRAWRPGARARDAGRERQPDLRRVAAGGRGRRRGGRDRAARGTAASTASSSRATRSAP